MSRTTTTIEMKSVSLAIAVVTAVFGTASLAAATEANKKHWVARGTAVHFCPTPKSVETGFGCDWLGSSAGAFNIINRVSDSVGRQFYAVKFESARTGFISVEDVEDTRTITQNDPNEADRRAAARRAIAQKKAGEAGTLCTAPPIKFINIQDLAKILREGNVNKKEFETTVEHTKRIAPVLSDVQKILEGTGKSSLVFAIAINGEYFKYDADRQKMAISGGLQGNILRRIGDQDVTVWETETAIGSYEAVNAFGLKKIISKRLATSIKVTLPKRPFDDAVRIKKPIEFQLPRDEAPTARNNIMVMMVGHLKSPYHSKREFHLNPTMNFPYDYQSVSDIIHTDISCAALFNRTTGRVLRPLLISNL